MSENLKRAESLFNRIMNPNKPQTEPKKHSSSYRNNNHNGSHQNGLGNSHHRHSYNKYNKFNHLAAPSPSVVADLPKRNPSQEAADAVALLPPGQHVLPYCWAIWHHLRTKRGPERNGDEPEAAKVTGADSYLQNTTEIDFPQYGNPSAKVKAIASVEQMWASLSTLKKLYNLAYGTELLVFKAGVNPVWEDPNNAKGGRWVFRFSHRYNSNEPADEFLETAKHGRQRAALIWERLVLKTLSGSFITDAGPNKVSQILGDIVGLVLSVRRDEEIISVWNSNTHFGKKSEDDDDKKKQLTPFQARRVICYTVLRVIRECDMILQGSDSVDTFAKASTERVSGVTFDYRLHSDSFSLHGTNDRRRGKHHEAREKEEDEEEDDEDESSI